MKTEELESINEQLMEVFRGLMHGNISYRQDKLHSAMGTCIGEVFDSIAGGFGMKIVSGEEISTDDLKLLQDSLIAFKKEYRVKELTPIIENINKILES